MKITTISLGRTFNMGDHETMIINLDAGIEENENIQQSFLKLDKEIDNYYRNKNHGK